MLSISDIIDVKVEAFKAGRFDALGLLDKQIEAMEALTDNTTEELLFGGAAGGGKSWQGCEWLLWSCVSYPGTNWFIGRKVLKQIKKSTLKTFHKVAKKHGFKIGIDYKVNEQDSYIRFSNGENGFKDGSNIDLLELKYKPSDTEYEDFGSLEYTGGWIEEGGEVHMSAWEVLTSRIGRHLNDVYDLIGKLLVTCNPKRNWMYRKYYKPFKDGTIEKFRKFIQSLITDNSRIESNYLEKLNRLTGSKKKRLRFGIWEYDDDPSKIMKPGAIESLPYNEFIQSGEKRITADIALRGSDLFVVGYWDDWRLEEIVYVEKCEMDVVEWVIRDVAKRNGVKSTKDVCVDVDGIGSGLKGYLKGVVSFVANEAPVKDKGDKNYNKINDQVQFMVADKVNKKEMFIDVENIKKYAPLSESVDLENFNPSEWGYEKVNGFAKFEMIAEEMGEVKEDESFEGKLKIVSKKFVKQVLGRSPDWWDMIKQRAKFDLKAPKIQFKRNVRTIKL